MPFGSRNEPVDPRRRLLIEALAIGALSAGVFPANVRAQEKMGSVPGFPATETFGDKPAKLPPGQSIYRITGSATVNGAPATLRTQIRPGDTVETTKASEIIFAVGSHAMLLRADSRLTIDGEMRASAPLLMNGKTRDSASLLAKGEASESASLLIKGLRLLTGKLLSVSRNTNMQVTTAAATIGIRGTGWYAESDPEQTYFCTCYGVAEISASSDPGSREVVASKHHDRPLYILARSAQGSSIRNAPAINHTDQELALIEALVGRTLPFAHPYSPPPTPPAPPPAPAGY